MAGRAISGIDGPGGIGMAMFLEADGGKLRNHEITTICRDSHRIMESLGPRGSKVPSRRHGEKKPAPDRRLGDLH
jgi:hypothetical protein